MTDQKGYVWGEVEGKWCLLLKDGSSYFIKSNTHGSLKNFYPTKTVEFQLKPGMVWKHWCSSPVVKIINIGWIYYNKDLRIKTIDEISIINLFHDYIPLFDPKDYIGKD